MTGSIGNASCVGGVHPDPPLDGFPRLAWMPAHPEHGSKVFTEDGRASVEDIASASETTDVGDLASHFGTTTGHVIEAIEYAHRAGLLS